LRSASVCASDRWVNHPWTAYLFGYSQALIGRLVSGLSSGDEVLLIGPDHQAPLFAAAAVNGISWRSI
jgi:hypothetical protein